MQQQSYQLLHYVLLSVFYLSMETTRPSQMFIHAYSSARCQNLHHILNTYPCGYLKYCTDVVVK